MVSYEVDWVRYAHLHSDQSVVDQDFFCQKVCANGGLVAGAELLVDLHIARLSALLFLALAPAAWVLQPDRYRTYWFIKLVLPTPLSPRIMTCVLSEHDAIRRIGSSWRSDLQ